jgi:dTDP-4-dehydrorhamnose 3,5-epimerase
MSDEVSRQPSLLTLITSESMQIEGTAISGVKILTAPRFTDRRGFFAEWFNRAKLKEAGIDLDFCQDNISLSTHVGTLRGLHFQLPPAEQTKLVGVVRGRIFDVALDLRRGSPTYRRHVAVELSADRCNQLLIPAGFAHGFCTLEPDSLVFYKVSSPFSAPHDSGIRWNDPSLGIDWPVKESSAVLSEKDAKLPFLADTNLPFRHLG